MERNSGISMATRTAVPSLGSTLTSALQGSTATPLGQTPAPLRVIANINLTNRSRNYSGSITERRPNFIDFRLDRQSDLRVEVTNRSGGSSRSRRIQVRLRRGSQNSALFTVFPGDRDSDRLRLRPANYRLELRTFSNQASSYNLRLVATNVNTARTINFGNITGEQRTTTNSLNRNSPVNYEFRVTRTRDVVFDLQNRLRPDFFDFLGERNISANLFGSGVREPLFSASPGDRDTEFVRLRSGTYRLELRANLSSNVPFRLRLVG